MGSSPIDIVSLIGRGMHLGNWGKARLKPLCSAVVLCPTAGSPGAAQKLVLADHRPDASIRAISTSKAHHRGRRRRRLRAMIVIYISKKITDFRRRHRYHDRSMIVVPVAGVESLLIQCGRRFLVSNPWRRMINHGSRNPKCHNRLLDLVLARAQWLRHFANHHFPQSIGSRLF